MKAILSSLPFVVSILTSISMLAGPSRQAPATVDRTAHSVVYRSGLDGYDTYRIPALVVTNSGALLAFTEGRKHSRSDTGDINLLLKRSEDRGKTWSHQQVIWDDGPNVCGNPSPVVDRSTGTVWLLMTWNRGDDAEREIIDGTSADTRRVFITSSDDDGRTWSRPEEITDSVKPASWTWYATGPGAGIQLTQGARAGRLVIPCDHIEQGSKRYFSHAIYSDDHGKTWNLGGSSPQDQVNECQVAELTDGRLLLNMRNYSRAARFRQVAFSNDGGITWAGQRFDGTLVEPICQASLKRAGDSLLFSNPADADRRINMTVRTSVDEGQTWRVLHRLYDGPSAYSDLALISRETAGCLYERGIENPYEEIALARFPVPESMPQPDPRIVETATASSEIAGRTLSKIRRWLHEIALPRIDKTTGLYIADGTWNYRDTAADCYPFLVWAAWAVDRNALNGPIRSVLDAEQRLCNTLDRIPAPYDLKAGKVVSLKPEDLVFEASEYVKDGLIAIVEVTGPDAWFDRMRAIEDDLWKHASVETPHGRIVSNTLEVNGEQIQALARLFSMTGDQRYLDWADRLVDFYLADPGFLPNRMRDHGCEIIGGMGLLLGVESAHRPNRAAILRPRLQWILDTILERGCNRDGFMYNEIERRDFGDSWRNLSDSWGYNYVTYLCFDLASRENRYRSRVEEVLRSLSKPDYRDYPWEGESIDGYADSVEGAIYLLNRVPVREGLGWVDRETLANVVDNPRRQEEGELWGTMKLQSNGVRTALMHALMHTRGTTAHPWRDDLKLGAVQDGDSLVLVASSEEPWEGIVVFDIPRHREYMGFTQDWPRMNTLPEWFTVDLERSYRLTIDGVIQAAFTGRQLHNGLVLSLSGKRRMVLEIRPD